MASPTTLLAVVEFLNLIYLVVEAQVDPYSSHEELARFAACAAEPVVALDCPWLWIDTHGVQRGFRRALQYINFPRERKEGRSALSLTHVHPLGREPLTPDEVQRLYLTRPVNGSPSFHSECSQRQQGEGKSVKRD